ncbi:MAG: hypothetical protein LQ347_003638, partial [Umbilicaria vellea]
QRADGFQLSVRGGIMQRRVAVVVRRGEEKPGIRRERQERGEERGGARAGREHQLLREMSTQPTWYHTPRRGRGGGDYGISSMLVLPSYTAREPRREGSGDCAVGLFNREHEGRVPVGVARDAIIVVAGVDEELDDFVEAELRGQV